MSSVSDELERIALSRNDQAERDELLKLYTTVLLMESERAALWRLPKRVAELERLEAEVVAELRQWLTDARYYAESEDGGAYGAGVTKGLTEASNLVAEKLGVK